MPKLILIIDDDPDFRSAVRMILEKEGFDCIEASSAYEGLRLSSEENPDLILLDVMMEDISSGFRFVKERRHLEDENAEAHIPVLIITSIEKIIDLDFKDRVKDILLSIDDFIDKPVTPKKLIAKINDMVFNDAY
ncbi:PleD family two-component system response regulator [bacterium]